VGCLARRCLPTHTQRKKLKLNLLPTIQPQKTAVNVQAYHKAASSYSPRTTYKPMHTRQSDSVRERQAMSRSGQEGNTGETKRQDTEHADLASGNSTLVNFFSAEYTIDEQHISASNRPCPKKHLHCEDRKHDHRMMRHNRCGKKMLGALVRKRSHHVQMCPDFPETSFT
jgi:hypothetical protein